MDDRRPDSSAYPDKLYKETIEARLWGHAPTTEGISEQIRLKRMGTYAHRLGTERYRPRFSVADPLGGQKELQAVKAHTDKEMAKMCELPVDTLFSPRFRPSLLKRDKELMAEAREYRAEQKDRKKGRVKVRASLRK